MLPASELQRELPWAFTNSPLLLHPQQNTSLVRKKKNQKAKGKPPVLIGLQEASPAAHIPWAQGFICVTCDLWKGKTVVAIYIYKYGMLKALVDTFSTEQQDSSLNIRKKPGATQTALVFQGARPNTKTPKNRQVRRAYFSFRI